MNKTAITYALRRSPRAKTLSVTIKGRSDVVVTAPLCASASSIERFVTDREGWIMRKLDELRHMPGHLFLQGGKRRFRAHKEVALSIARKRLAHFNASYGFSYGAISIRDQKTRWGSASRSGRLSFNYKIALLPERLRDYVIVHELCHLKEMNHSKRFWALVARTIPEYARLRAELNGKRAR